MFSTSVSRAGFVNSELKAALRKLDEMPEGKVFVIPVRLDNCEMPERLRHLQWCDYFTQGGAEALVSAVRHHIETPVEDTGEIPRVGQEFRFANVMIDTRDPHWAENDCRRNWAENDGRRMFRNRAARFLHLKDFVHSADLMLHVTLINEHPGPLLA